MAEHFSTRFKRILKERGISDTEAAYAASLSVSQIARIKSGVNVMMKLDDALRFCDKLGIDPWELAFGTPRKPAEAETESPSLKVEQLAGAVSEIRTRLEAIDRELSRSRQEAESKPARRRKHA